MLCRDIDAARAVADDIRRQHPAARVDSLHCDLADLASVRSTALQIRAQYPSPALLINNAGVASTRHRMSTDGFELNFAINHLGHFLLTDLLRDRMADHGRIVIVASRSPLSSTAAPGCTSTNTSSLPR